MEPLQDDKPKHRPRKKPRKAIKDLAGFITYAYSRRRQPLLLKPNVEKAICKNPRLDDESRRQLLRLAKNDVLLAVPRQILLAVRNITGFPLLRNEVRDFIKDVFHLHPVFSIPEVQGALNNADDSLDPRSVLILLSEFDYSKLPELENKKLLKPKDREILRINAVYSLAVWLSETRYISFERLNQYLFTALWQPKAIVTKDEATQLKIITNIYELSGVGVACLGFKHQTDYQTQLADVAKNAKQSALERLQSLEHSYKLLQHDLEKRDQSIAELLEMLETEKQMHEDTRTHLSDDLEQMRAKLLRRLNSEVKLLSEGLHALRRDPPKVQVMEDHAERVLYGLKAEIKGLDLDE